MDHSESRVAKLIQEDDGSKSTAHSNRDLKLFTEIELESITSNYRTMIGKGGFGEVFKGVLEDGSMVAVKRLIQNVKENFAKELDVHREINHKNVVRLIGCCRDENAFTMVTEYIPNGNLSDALHKEKIPMSLDARLGIAIECAEALGYMHSQMNTRVIHGDIKPANILLDEKLGVKVSDFGISRLVNTDNTVYTVNVAGSRGYMDPLFAMYGRLSAKNDVYSFGVVLLELITRKMAWMDDGETNLVGTFSQARTKGVRRLRGVFDPEIATSSEVKTAEEIVKLASECLTLEHKKRPEMLELAERLRKLRKVPRQRQKGKISWPWGGKKQHSPAQTPSGRPSRQRSSTSGSGSTTVCSSFAGSEAEDVVLDESAQVLGKGTVGTTYKVVLDDGSAIVIKKLDGVDLMEAEFELRVAAIGDAAEECDKVLPLVGYHFTDQEKLVSYFYMPMGSLARALHGDGASPPEPMDWYQRLCILSNVVDAVESIHSVGPSSSHGNIKSSNVLLEDSHAARLSEHGLGTLTGGPSTPKASGYRAPEVSHHSHTVSQKADVYSLGILMLELFTRKAPATPGEDLLGLVSSVAHDKWVAQILDAELRLPDEETRHMIMQLLQLAMDCCTHNADLRPSMSDVRELLQYFLRKTMLSVPSL